MRLLRRYTVIRQRLPFPTENCVIRDANLPNCTLTKWPKTVFWVRNDAVAQPSNTQNPKLNNSGLGREISSVEFFMLSSTRVQKLSTNCETSIRSTTYFIGLFALKRLNNLKRERLINNMSDRGAYKRCTRANEFYELTKFD